MIAFPVANLQPTRLNRGAAGSNIALLVFIVISLSVSMSVTQEEAPQPGSLRYWLLILPAVLLPMTQLNAIFRNLLTTGSLLLIFFCSAALWQLKNLDMRALLQLCLLVFITAWVSSKKASLSSETLVVIFYLAILSGITLYFTTGLNKWGPIPGLTADEFGIWRVSFFPNIANSAFLSLVIIMVITKDMGSVRPSSLTLGLAIYFLVFSFVRSALIALAVYAALYWWLSSKPTTSRLFWAPILVGITVSIFIATSAEIFNSLQDIPLISRLFLRGETQLSSEEIYQQMYRPWLWWEHIQQFLDSPYLMGLGTFDFDAIKKTALIEGQVQSDTVSLLTRLIAVYGLPGILFTAYLFVRHRAAAKVRDIWACACFPAVLILAMQWGSVFHPTDAFFSLFVMMVVRGRDAFSSSVKIDQRIPLLFKNQ